VAGRAPPHLRDRLALAETSVINLSTAPPTRHPRKGEIDMGDTRGYISLYDQRIRLVADALEQNSGLGEAEALELAVHVLHAIDHVPEKVR
jgi:hypothetical protein